VASNQFIFQLPIQPYRLQQFAVDSHSNCYKNPGRSRMGDVILEFARFSITWRGQLYFNVFP
jgi:hypothetical protein